MKKWIAFSLDGKIGFANGFLLFIFLFSGSFVRPLTGNPEGVDPLTISVLEGGAGEIPADQPPVGSTLQWRVLEDHIVISPPMVDHDLWLKLKITPGLSEETKVLYIITNNLDYAGLYEFDNGVVTKKESGFLVPVDQWEYPAPFPFFRIKETGQKQYFLKLRSRLTIEAEIRLDEDYRFLKVISLHSGFKILYLLFTIGSIFYALVLFAKYRARLFIFYVGYIISGIGSVYFSFGAAVTDFGGFFSFDQALTGIFLLPVTMLFGLLFGFDFLRVKYFLGRVYFIKYLLIALYLALIVTFPFGQHYLLKAKLIALANVLLIFQMIVLAVVIAVKGHKPALIYLLVWGMMLAAILIYGLFRLGVIPYNFWVVYSVPLTISIDFILFNIGIYYKVASEFNISEYFNVKTEQISKYKKSYISNLPVEQILDNLQRMMEVDKIYQRDSALTAARVAKKLGILPYQLAEILSQVMGTTFYNFLNKYRVDEAIRLMEEGVQERIIDIAFDAGFQSKSGFNSVFKQFTGKTPTEYAREVQLKEKG